MQAFNGDAALKAQMIESVRPRWESGALIPCAILKWSPEQHAYSLSAGLIESSDADEFERRTGIPVEFATFCESLMVVNTVLIQNADNPMGWDLRMGDAIKAFGLEWLQAIRPGADLSEVLPRYIVQFMETALSPGFEMAPQIEPVLRDAANKVLGLWKRDLAGQPIEPKEWRQARGAAVLATEQQQSAWAHPLAHLVETLAWPLRDVKKEISQPFMYLAMTWAEYVSRSFLTEEDQRNQILALSGMRKVAIAEREPDFDDRAREAFMDSIPEEKKAMFAGADPAVRDRLKAARIDAFSVTVPLFRRQMDEMLTLIKTC